jgi:hypothetical protein
MNPLSLLGHHWDTHDLQAFFAAIREEPEISTAEDRTYYQFKGRGFSLLVDDRLVLSCIHLYSEGLEGYCEYADELPCGLHFAHSRRVIRERLGTPSQSGEGEMIDFFGKCPPWDRYQMLDRTVHCQYAADEQRIVLISIMTLEGTPS